MQDRCSAHPDVSADVVGVVFVQPGGRNAARGDDDVGEARGETLHDCGDCAGLIDRGPGRNVCVSPERPTAAGVNPGRVGGGGLCGKHHRPVCMTAAGDRPLGVGHLGAGTTQVQRRHLPQAFIRPRNILGENEVHFCDTRPVTVAPQRAGIWDGSAAVDVEQRGGRGVVEDYTRWGVRTSVSVWSTPPCARKSSISASATAWLPPIGTGQPRCAPASPTAGRLRPKPTMGSREIAWAATPVNKARASSPRRVPHAGVPCSATLCARRVTAGNPGGSERLSPSRKPTTSSARAVNGPSRRRHEAPSASPAQVRSRSRYARAAGRPGSGLAYEISGTASPTPGPKVELGEEWRSQRQRMDRRADVVVDAGELRIRQCGRRRPASVGPRRPAPTARAGAHYRRGQPVGSATDDRDVHAVIRPHYAVPVTLPVVLIADKLAPSTVAALGDQVEVRWVDGPDRPKLLEAVADADALLVRSATTVDAEVIAAAPKLKIIARAGVGLDNVDVDAATAAGVGGQRADLQHPQRRRARSCAAVVHRPADPGRRRHPARAQLEAILVQRHRDLWQDRRCGGSWPHRSAGCPATGRLGTHVIAYDPYVPPARAGQLGIELLPLDDVLSRADFISVHLPKTKETAGLLGKEALAKTKPGVIIVNAARGGLIDEHALSDAIISGHVRGAGLDVFATEPCTDSPLFDLPQVVVTPHLGASTSEAQDRAGTDVAERQAGAGR